MATLEGEGKGDSTTLLAGNSRQQRENLQKEELKTPEGQMHPMANEVPRVTTVSTTHGDDGKEEGEENKGGGN